MTYTIHPTRMIPGGQFQTQISDPSDEIVALFYADTEEESARLARKFVLFDEIESALIHASTSVFINGTDYIHGELSWHSEGMKGVHEMLCSMLEKTQALSRLTSTIES